MKMILATYLIFLSFSASATQVSVMTYNVENLFDTVHDEGKEDYSYLPKKVKDASPKIQAYCKGLPKKSWRRSCLTLDWSESTLDKKIQNIAKVITSYGTMGPDIVVIEEIENINALQMLANEMASSGYKYIGLIEGEDKRGIDNGVISRYPIVSEKLHHVDLSAFGKKTRGIYEAKIQVGNASITILANHWPSQGTKNPAVRAAAAKILVKAAKQIKSNIVIALGDFNVVPSNDGDLLERLIEPHFINAEKEARNQGTEVFDGSHWFAGHWGTLDKIYIYKSIKAASKMTFIDYTSYEVVKRDFMLASKDWTFRDTGETRTFHGVPFRFDTRKVDGYSDHLPLVISLRL